MTATDLDPVQALGEASLAALTGVEGTTEKQPFTVHSPAWNGSPSSVRPATLKEDVMTKALFKIRDLSTKHFSKPIHPCPKLVLSGSHFVEMSVQTLDRV
jgi:hypothetical protein